MKHSLHILLTLLLLSLGSVAGARADGGVWTNKYISSVSEAITEAPTTAGYYILYNVGRGTFLHEDGTSLMLTAISGASGSSSSDLPTASNIQTAVFGTGFIEYVVYVSPVSGGTCERTRSSNTYTYNTYTIQLKSGKYIPTLSAGDNMSTGTTAENFTIESISSSSFAIGGTTQQAYIQLWGSNIGTTFIYANGNGSTYGSEGSFTGWSATFPDGTDNGSYLFFPVTLSDEVDIACTITDPLSPNSPYTQTFKGVPGKTFPSENGTYYTLTYNTINSADYTGSETVAESGNTATATLTYSSDCPFTVSKFFDDGATWQAMKFRSDRWLTANRGAEPIATAEQLRTTWAADPACFTDYDSFVANRNDNRLYAIKGDPFNGYQFYNKNTGYLIATGSNTAGGSNAVMSADSTSSTTYFIIETDTSGNYYARVKDGTSDLSNYGGGKTTTLQFYATSQRDPGSAITFVKEASLPAFAAENIPTAPSAGNIAGCVGYFDFTTAKSASSALGDETTYNTYKTLLDTDKYYQIYACRSDAGDYRYISTITDYAATGGDITDATDARVITRITADKAALNIAPTLWKIEKQSDGTYKFRNANANKCMGKVYDDSKSSVVNSASITTLDSWSGNYNIPRYYFHLTTMNLQQANATTHYVNAMGGVDNANGFIGDYTSSTHTSGLYDTSGTYDAGYSWQLIPVSTFTLPIYTDTNWASCCFPFAVKLPDGLKAYAAKGTDANGWMKLCCIGASGASIPAYCPFLLTDEAETKSGTLTGSGTDERRTYTLTIDYDDATSYSGSVTNADDSSDSFTNQLSGATVQRTGFEAGSGTDCSFYFLTSNGNGGGKFIMNGTHTSVSANRAYLLPDNVKALSDGTAAPALLFSLWDGGDVTGIGQAATPAASGQGEWYDLQGRRVLYPAHGIFVNDRGEKHFLK